MMVGMYVMEQNFQGLPSTNKLNQAKCKVEAHAPKNVYGSECFIIKVQPPGDGSHSGPCGFASRKAFEGSGKPWACMVYDEPRTLRNVYLPLDTPGIEAVLKLILRDGVRVASGSYKAYFEAVREGPCLRIYTDRLAPKPDW
jgi:hypothetical protein